MNSQVAEQIKERLPVTDVLSSYITLIPAGKQFKAKCPFHNERTASFSISPERGLYYCFGCGAKGDIFTFVQQFEGVDFNGALKILAERAGVELTTRDRKVDDRAPVYECLEKATQRYQNELQKNNQALHYLKGRGITPETIAQFRIGYAPEEWRFIANTCTIEADKKIAERAGLIKRREESRELKVEAAESQQKPSSTPHAPLSDYYDRFRGRIMFPLSDSSGRIVGFSGRIFPETAVEKDGAPSPKYLNSPETEVFQKSRVLYGFDKAKFHIKRVGFAIMVEGQMDLLLSHQAGFRNTVATSGTAVSEQMAEDLSANLVVVSRLTPHLFLAFDGDTAGQKALSRAALVALSLGMNPKVVPIPAGTDPAEYLLKEGAEEWKARVKASEHFIVHQARTVKQKELTPHMLVREVKESVFPFLSRVVSPIEQKLYIEAVARELALDSGEVEREYTRFVSMIRTPFAENTNVETPLPSSDAPTVRERCAALKLRFPDEMTALMDDLESVTFAGQTFGAIELDEERSALALAMIERDYGVLTEAERVLAAQELVAKARSQFFLSIKETLSRQLREAELVGNEEQTQELLRQLTEINKRGHET